MSQVRQTQIELSRGLPAALERVTRRFASQVALDSPTWQTTHAELDARTNGLARILLTQGGAKGDRIALLMRHDTPLIAAMLGVVKAGRVVVVLNPSDPVPRLGQVLTDAEPRLILTDEVNREVAERIARVAVSMVDPPRTEPASSPGISIAPDDLAFLIYTSGSTGRPKGVKITHRNVQHNVRRLTRGISLVPTDRVALLGSLGGGQGLATSWYALLSGAALCPYPVPERGVMGLAGWLHQHRISVHVSTSSLFRSFVATLDRQERFSSVRLLRLGAEATTSEDFAAFVRHYSAQAILLHTYSSSETGNITQFRRKATDWVPEGRLPVGWPVDGIELALIDEQGHPVPAGQTGQVVVRGQHLSPGYWRNDDLTKERFTGDGVRAYRGGDLGRWNADGSLVLMGRKDGQVKIRGHLVEPAEVEEALLRQPGVRQAVVCPRGKDAEGVRLVAYVTVRAGCDRSGTELRRTVKELLPAHLVPDECLILDRFPLTAHGKVDRDALGQIQAPSRPGSTSLPQLPATETEAILAEIWKQVLGDVTVTRDATLFDLGGHSLEAAAVASRAAAELGIEVDVRTVATGSLAELAKGLDERRRTSRDRDPAMRRGRVARGGPFPLSFAQEGIWRHWRTPEGSTGYVKSRVGRIRGPVDADLIREGIDMVVRRHEILRTTFHEIDGRTVQIVHPPRGLDVPNLDLGGGSSPEEEAARFLRREGKRLFDLSKLPLVRFWLVRIRDDEHWLLRVSHHIVSDSASWMIFLEELGQFLDARLRGVSPGLPTFEPLHYADYAVWERRDWSPRALARQAALAWWKDRLAGNPPPLELPFRRDEPRPDAAPGEGYLWWGLEPDVSRRLSHLARQENAKYFVIRLACFVALLAFETGQEEVVLGTYVSNRENQDTHKLFGMFGNLVALRFACRALGTFRNWLAVVRNIVIETQARGEVPWGELEETFRKQGQRLPEIRAIFQVSEQTSVRSGAVELAWLDRQVARMPWGFSLTLAQHQEQHHCWAAFDARLHDPAGVRRFLDRYGRLLDEVSRHPDHPMAELLVR